MMNRVFFAWIRTLVLIIEQGGATAGMCAAIDQAPISLRPFQNDHSDVYGPFTLVFGELRPRRGTARLC